MSQKFDPIAYARETPDVSALFTEFDAAQLIGPVQGSTIATAEDVRYNRWGGKSNPPDGKLHQSLNGGVTVRPYDQRPDTDVNLADELCGAEVDADMFAFTMASIGADTNSVSEPNAAKVAELAAVGRYIQKATRRETRRGAELLAQMKATLGWALLNPGWLERWELVTRALSLEQFEAKIDPQLVGREIPDAVLAQLPPEAQAAVMESAQYEKLTALIRQPDLEDQAAEIIQAAFPHLTSAKAKTIVRELREEGQTEFLDKQLAEKRPTVRVLIPGYNVFVSGGDQEIQDARGFLVIERMFTAQLETTGRSNDWNEEFIKAAAGTVGQFSVFGERLRVQDQIPTDSRDMGIEIWTTYVRQVDEETGVSGIYCTTFSPHLQPGAGRTSEGATEKKFFAKHYLLDYAHGQYPFTSAEREVIGPSMYDSRGVPEMVRSDQQVIKTQQDALAARAQWEVNPAQVQVGPGWSKVKDALAPGAVVSLPAGADVKFVGVDKGTPQVGELMIQRIENGTRRRFALPNNTDGSHPSGWQMRQARNSARWLGCWSDAYWQLAVLCYQEYSADELAQILGRYPVVEMADLMSMRITLDFESRALDQDWTKTVLGFVKELMLVDKGGVIDPTPWIRIAANYIDPTIAQSVIRDPQEANAALYRKVESDVASIMDGNPPHLVEMDASAGTQLKMVFQVMGQNQKYQALLQQDPMVRQNFEQYVKNLQHSNQETTISPVQGRLGVTDAPQTPVRYGTSPVAAQ